jgi:oligoribonuclease
MQDMGPWCMEQHTKSGLVQQVLDSQLSMIDAETAIIDFIEKITCVSTNRQRLILAGNSVYVDRYFLEKDMPRLHAMLDPIIIDCSTLKECIIRINPVVYSTISKYSGSAHRALDDIRNSIQQFQSYKSHAFIERTCQQERLWTKQTDVDQYLLWIDIDVNIHGILTDGNLNVIDEICQGKTADDVIEFLYRHHVQQEARVPIAGRNLGVIRAQLKNRALKLNEFCHYRSVDVDVITLLCEQWFPHVHENRPISIDGNTLMNSIELLRYYRSTIFQ